MNTKNQTPTQERLGDLERRITTIEKKLDKPNETLLNAFDIISKDMHSTSSRPCESCILITKVIGKPFGCEVTRLAREKRFKESKPQ
jgi:hypothetical protein